MTTITISREQTKQIRQYEPLKLSMTIEAEIGDGQNAETEIKRLSELLSKAIHEEFEKESVLILESEKKAKT